MDKMTIMLSVLTSYCVLVCGLNTTLTTTTAVQSIPPLGTSTGKGLNMTTVLRANDTLNGSTNTTSTSEQTTPSATVTKVPKLTTTPATTTEQTTNLPYEGALTETEELAIILTAVVIGTAVAIVLVALMSRYFLTSKTLSQEQKQKFKQGSISNGLPAFNLEMADYDNVQTDNQYPSTSSGSGR
ncbi:hypothetical protein LOTGIDRAFT_165064 [Lottia gigantea]|uniref:Syndecan/Neurexin domain-containing protein n=1 Tax=Lottia gigantea TaxID=225164 RepID=V4A3F9_LOTGI|nr:hypothetical protein LOTGIDRAFT_165064 [Lottia gigantea]ESO89470.1 hypothetical protein LOTGIDRAFT_165064 [Lottia gigantea]